MSLLSDYEQRTAWKYAPISGNFHTAEDLTRKVRLDGSYAPFPGTTVVFRLGKQELGLTQLMQQVLAQALEGTDMLASPLPPSALHMTLHDLISPENCASDPEDRIQYDREMTASLKQAAEIAARISKDFAGRKIAMVADRIVNMVSKSLVLMLRPRTEEDFELLLEMYRRFDSVAALSYPLTPHITLAYYKPGMLDGAALGRAVDFAQICPENAPVFMFDPEALTAQSFRDMRNYTDVPRRICLCCDGGLNRSMMAANILNTRAEARNLPVQATARAAYPNTREQLVPQQVWETLEKHGIQPDRSQCVARYLEDFEASHFTEFAGISAGAMERFAWLGIPKPRFVGASQIFCGARDPQYGEVTYEQMFDELEHRVERYLDAYDDARRLHLQADKL